MPVSDTYVALVSLSWNDALISFALPDMSHVAVEAVLPHKDLLAHTTDQSTIGRLVLTHLTPDTPYTVRVRWDAGAAEIRFRTLPPPRGPLLASFAAVADTHLSLNPENRKGRLFVESVAIFRDLVEECNRIGVDFVLLAGDATNKATDAEYAAAAGVLSHLQCPCLAVPGDHDIKPETASQWRRQFGDRSWHRMVNGFSIFGIDTSGGVLGADGKKLLESHWHQEAPFRVLVSHHQLIPDEYIRLGKRKIITDFDDQRPFLEQLFKKRAMIYAGHQNVPSIAALGNALQLNLPQTIQFPCGYILVRQYENGLYHTFRPILSEVLNSFSRTESNLAAIRYGEPQWNQTYRSGKDINASCFLYPTEEDT